MNLTNKLKNFFKDGKNKTALIAGLVLGIFVFAYFILPPRILYLRFILNTYQTPQDAIQIEMPSILNNPKIKISAIAYRITSPNSIKTYRDEENIYNIAKKASSILNQADIEIEIEDIKNVDVDLKSFKEDGSFRKQLFKYFNNLSDFNDGTIRIIFIKRNPRFNFIQAGGTSYKEDGMAYVIDRYYSDDFRVLAHEIGHLLGLSHHEGSDFVNESSEYLMSGGLHLTKEEIETAYKNAELRFNK